MPTAKISTRENFYP